MEVVLDANVLFRMLISQGEILDIVFNEKLHIFAPLKLKEEFLKHKKEIVSKSKITLNEFKILSSLIFKRINFAPLEKYKNFLIKARKILGSHTKDEDFVALCLYKSIKLWTYEDFLFKLGVGISTKQISLKL